MAAIDLAARALQAAIAEVDAQCLGQDFGVAVFAQQQPIPQDKGLVMVPGWWIALTMRNPLIGAPPLVHFQRVGLIEPVEATIKAEVASGLRQLRELAAQKVNGTAKGM